MAVVYSQYHVTSNVPNLCFKDLEPNKCAKQERRDVTTPSTKYKHKDEAFTQCYVIEKQETQSP